jgi:hypothetical protein
MLETIVPTVNGHASGAAARVTIALLYAATARRVTTTPA